jgi:hypothetical protein
MVKNKFSSILKSIIFEEEMIFASIKQDIQNIENEIKKINSNDVSSDFIKLWEHYLKLMNSNVDKYEVDKLIENIKELKKSYIVNQSSPHKNLEKIINNKNILLNNLLNKVSLVSNIFCSLPFPEQRSNYLTNLYEEKELTLLEQIDKIVETLRFYNNDKLAKDFIESWNSDCDFIKNKIEKDELEQKDIKQIQNVISEIINSLVFYFVIPHKQLQELLNILTLKDKYIFIFKK